MNYSEGTKVWLTHYIRSSLNQIKLFSMNTNLRKPRIWLETTINYMMLSSRDNKFLYLSHRNTEQPFSGFCESISDIHIKIEVNQRIDFLNPALPTGGLRQVCYWCLLCTKSIWSITDQSDGFRGHIIWLAWVCYCQKNKIKWNSLEWSKKRASILLTEGRRFDSCPWARYWTPNCSWCAGQHLAWQPLPSVYELL